MKVCSRCKISKKLDEFSKNKALKDGLNCYCRLCHRAINKSNNVKYKEYRIEYNANYWKKQVELDPEFYVKRGLKYRYFSLEGKVSNLLSGAKARSRKSGCLFELTKEWLLAKFQAQDGRCSLTGIKFEYSHKAELDGRHNPFSPSLDRIDRTKGYTERNTRLVCTWANIALNDFGEGVFKQMCMEYLKFNKIKVDF